MRLLVHTRFVHIVLGLALTVLASAFAAPQHAAAASERGLDQPWQAITDPQRRWTADLRAIWQRARRAVGRKSSASAASRCGTGGMAPIRQRDGLPDDRANTLFEDRLGRIWVATNTGVGYLAGEPLAFRKVDLAGLLPCRCWRLRRSRGCLWMECAPNGLARWADDGILDNVAQFRGQLVTVVGCRGRSVVGGCIGGLRQRSGDEWRPVDELGPVRGAPGGRWRWHAMGEHRRSTPVAQPRAALGSAVDSPVPARTGIVARSRCAVARHVSRRCSHVRGALGHPAGSISAAARSSRRWRWIRDTGSWPARGTAWCLA